jgi:hypothetical protein
VTGWAENVEVSYLITLITTLSPTISYFLPPVTDLKFSLFFITISPSIRRFISNFVRATIKQGRRASMNTKVPTPTASDSFKPETCTFAMEKKTYTHGTSYEFTCTGCGRVVSISAPDEGTALQNLAHHGPKHHTVAQREQYQAGHTKTA